MATKELSPIKTWCQSSAKSVPLSPIVSQCQGPYIYGPKLGTNPKTCHQDNTIPKQQFTLTLRAEPGNWAAPPLMRFRAALKTLLRSYGLRCTHIKEDKP